MQKSPAQLLFNRLITTWIAPAVTTRVKDPSVQQQPLRMALIVWERGATAAAVFINDEVPQHVGPVKIKAARPFEAGPIGPSDIGGLKQVTLAGKKLTASFIFVIEGSEGRYFVWSRGTHRVLGVQDFDVLREPLSEQGVKLEVSEETLSIYFDVVRNLYDGLSSPSQKRRETLRSIETRLAYERQRAKQALRRQRKMPTVMVHHNSEFVPLLRETRDTYIDGYYFAALASAVTTADRICNRLIESYPVEPTLRSKMLKEFTFGQKIGPLRSRQIISSETEGILWALNRIRNEHLHPKGPFSEAAQKRAALRAVKLLHELLANTFSVFRDYEIKEGRLVPKPLT